MTNNPETPALAALEALDKSYQCHCGSFIYAEQFFVPEVLDTIRQALQSPACVRIPVDDFDKLKDAINGIVPFGMGSNFAHKEAMSIINKQSTPKGPSDE